MTQLGTGLFEVKAYGEALQIFEADLALQLRIMAPVQRVQVCKTNVANAYDHTGRHAEALAIRREIYAWREANLGFKQVATHVAALNLSASLLRRGVWGDKRSDYIAEVKLMLKKIIAVQSKRDLEAFYIMRLREKLALAETEPGGNLPKALKMFKDLERDVVRVLGAAHPFTDDVQYNRKATEAQLARQSAAGGPGGN